MNNFKNMYYSISLKHNAFYFFHLDKFLSNYYSFVNAFKKHYSLIDIAYSYKTNYLPFLVKQINSLGSKAEIVSSMEYFIAKKSGVKEHDMYYNGPIKDLNVAEQILKNSGTVNFDSYDDLMKLDFTKFNKTVNIGLRINSSINSEFSRFGISLETNDFIKIINFIKIHPNIHLKIIHFHLPQRNIDDWRQKLVIYFKKVSQISRIISFDEISLGGGFYSQMDANTKKFLNIKHHTTFSDYSFEVNLFIKKVNLLLKKQIKIILEPGTALVANTFDFVTKLYSFKQIDTRQVVSTFGSFFNTNPNNKATRLPYTVLNYNKSNLKLKNCSFVGFTCIESDYLVDNFSGNVNLKNSLLVLKNCGSYSIVMKPPFILMNYPIYTFDKQLRILKEQDSFDDIFNAYVF